MNPGKSTVDCVVLWGARAEIGLGYTLEATAVRLAEDIAELRDEGGLPAHVRTVTTVLPQSRVLEIRVEGLSIEVDPDRTAIREVTNALFELASYHNIVALDGITPPFVHPTHPARRRRRSAILCYGRRGRWRRGTCYVAAACAGSR
jgi:hypothetical protein